MAKAAVAESEGRERHWLDNKFIKQVTEALDEDGTTVIDVANKLGVSRGQVALAQLRGRVAVKDREALDGEDDETIGKRVKSLRDGENLSWGVISARLGVPESRVRSTYSTVTGNDHRGLRLEGKGGRSPVGNGTAPSTARASKPKAGLGKTEAEVNPDKKHLADMTIAELKTRLTGQTITVGRAAKSEKIPVKKVVKLSKAGEVTLIAADGKTRVVAIKDITRVTK